MPNTTKHKTQKNAEAELLDEIEQLKQKIALQSAILNSLPCSIRVTDSEQNTIYQNSSAPQTASSKTETSVLKAYEDHLLHYTISKNITDSHSMGANDSELRWKFAIEGSKNGLWDWDLITNKVFFSPQWKKMIGYEDHELKNDLSEWDERVHPDDKENAYDDIKRHLRGETEIYENEHRLRCKDGSYKWIYDRGKIISYSENGKPSRIIGTHSDITERREQEDKLRQNEERLKEAQKTAHIGHWELDINKNKLFWSDEVFRIFNLKPQEFEATYDAFLNNIHPDDREMVAKAYEDSLKNKTEYSVNHRLLLEDGTIKHVSERCKTYFDSKGNPISSIGTVADITEIIEKEAIIKQQNQELLASNTTKDKLFSVIAHDLKSPFNGIIGFSELALEYVSNKEYDQLEKSCQFINQTAHQCLDLLNNLLNWSRLQTGKIKMDPETILLKNIVKDNIDLLRSNCLKKNIQIATSISPNLSMEADINMIDSIIRNLLSNAIKFSYPDKTIYVSAKKTDDVTSIQVRDQGVGIEEEVKDSLFDTNENSSTHGTNSEKGTGLGLVLCKEFVHMHEGVIWVESKKGNGATFTFTIKDMSN